MKKLLDSPTLQLHVVGVAIGTLIYIATDPSILSYPRECIGLIETPIVALVVWRLQLRLNIQSALIIAALIFSTGMIVYYLNTNFWISIFHSFSPPRKPSPNDQDGFWAYHFGFFVRTFIGYILTVVGWSLAFPGRPIWFIAKRVGTP